jgi:hypothetical protein
MIRCLFKVRSALYVAKTASHLWREVSATGGACSTNAGKTDAGITKGTIPKRLSRDDADKIMLKLSNDNESYIMIPPELVSGVCITDFSVLAPLTLFVEGLLSLLSTARNVLIFDRMLVPRSVLLAASWIMLPRACTPLIFEGGLDYRSVSCGFNKLSLNYAMVF